MMVNVRLPRQIYSSIVFPVATTQAAGDDVYGRIWEKDAGKMTMQGARWKALKRVEHQVLQENIRGSSYPYWHATMRYGVHITKAHIAWCHENLNMLEQQERKRRRKKKTAMITNIQEIIY